MNDQKPIILLDLHGTLSANSTDVGSPWAPDISVERYRSWLIDLIRPCRVILVTWRPIRYRQPTLARIAAETGGWQPDEAYFRSSTLTAPRHKVQIIRQHVFPVHGSDRSLYLGLESNPRTRLAYAQIGIFSLPVPRGDQWNELPAVQSVETWRD